MLKANEVNHLQMLIFEYACIQIHILREIQGEHVEYFTPFYLWSGCTETQVSEVT